MRSKYCIIICILFFVSSKITAQTNESHIHFSVNTAYNFNENEFHNFWKPTPGVGFELSFDHTVGELGAGLTVMRFDKQIDLTKSFYAVDYYFLYRYKFNVLSKLNFINGFDFGIFEFRFDDDDDIKHSAERIEREFALKLIAGFSFDIAETWKAEITTSYQHIYTKKKIEFFFIGAAVQKSFLTPSWLKEFFE